MQCVSLDKEGTLWCPCACGGLLRRVARRSLHVPGPLSESETALSESEFRAGPLSESETAARGVGRERVVPGAGCCETLGASGGGVRVITAIAPHGGGVFAAAGTRVWKIDIEGENGVFDACWVLVGDFGDGEDAGEDGSESDEDEIGDLCVSRDGSFLCACLDDGTVRVLPTQSIPAAADSSGSRRLPKWHVGRPRDAAVSSGCAFRLDGRSRKYELWTSRLSGEVSRWDARGPNSLRHLATLDTMRGTHGLGEALEALKSRDDSCGPIADGLCSDMAGQVNPPMPNYISAHRSAPLVAVALGDGTVAIVHADGADARLRFRAHGCPCAHVKWAGERVILTSGASDGIVAAWTLSGSPVGRWRFKDPVNWFACHVAGGDESESDGADGRVATLAVALESEPPRVELLSIAAAIDMAAAQTDDAVLEMLGVRV